MFCMLKKKKYLAYVSKHNSNRAKQVIHVIISSGEKLCHYLAVTKISALLTEVTSKHYGDFCCLNCLHYLEQKTSLNYIKT